LVSSFNKIQLRDAIENGTKSWDVVGAKCLSLSMMTATGSRAGDLAVSSRYTDEASTRLKDMIIKIKKCDDGQIVFRSRLTPRSTNGQKQKQSKDHTVALDSTLNPIHNSLDPVKMLLTLTLRMGTVHAASIDQLIADTLAGPDRTVQWIHPDWALHPQLQGAGSSVKPSQPAGTQQFNRALQAAAETANIKVDLVPHDIRRGAVRDASRLSSTGTQSIEGARTLLAHSYGTMFSGVTEEYIGPTSTSTWEQRHLVGPEEEFDLHIDADMELPHPRRKRDSLDSLPLPGQGPKREKTTRSTTLLDYIDENRTLPRSTTFTRPEKRLWSMCLTLSTQMASISSSFPICNQTVVLKTQSASSLRLTALIPTRVWRRQLQNHPTQAPPSTCYI
jgi:hypothetical protein